MYTPHPTCLFRTAFMHACMHLFPFPESVAGSRVRVCVAAECAYGSRRRVGPFRLPGTLPLLQDGGNGAVNERTRMRRRTSFCRDTPSTRRTALQLSTAMGPRSFLSVPLGVSTFGEDLSMHFA